MRRPLRGRRAGAPTRASGRPRGGPIDGLIDFGAHLGGPLPGFLLAEGVGLEEARAEAVDRVVARPLLDLGARAVAAVVVARGVGDEAVGLRLDQLRAVAAAQLLDAPAHLLVDGEDVVAVDGRGLDVVAAGALGDVADGHLLLAGLGDGVAVVLAEEDHGQLVDGGEVERLVKVALGGGALAEVDDGDLVQPSQLRGVGDAGGVRQVGGDHAGAGDDALLGEGPVARHLASARVGVVGLGEEAEHDLLGAHAEHDHDARVAVVGQHPVDALLERVGGADLCRLVAGAGDREGGPALAVEDEHAVVDLAREQHLAVHAPMQIGALEAALRLMDAGHGSPSLPVIASASQAGRRRRL